MKKNKIMSIALIWFVAGAICVAIVKLTAIGEVIFVISETYGMGVHSFDLITIIPLTVAMLATIAKLRSV